MGEEGGGGCIEGLRARARRGLPRGFKRLRACVRQQLAHLLAASVAAEVTPPMDAATAKDGWSRRSSNQGCAMAALAEMRWHGS